VTTSPGGLSALYERRYERRQPGKVPLLIQEGWRTSAGVVTGRGGYSPAKHRFVSAAVKMHKLQSADIGHTPPLQLEVATQTP